MDVRSDLAITILGAKVHRYEMMNVDDGLIRFMLILKFKTAQCTDKCY